LTPFDFGYPFKEGVAIRGFTYAFARFIIISLKCWLELKMKVRKGIIVLVLGLVLLLGACSGQQMITKDEAIDIASRNLPPDIPACTITAKLVPAIGPHGAWQIIFDNLNPPVTRDALGWQESHHVLLGPEDSYSKVLIDVDAVTGDILLKMATNAPSTGGPIPAPTNWGLIGGLIGVAIVVIGLLVYFLWWRRLSV
jgi:hypothetical protein